MTSLAGVVRSILVLAIVLALLQIELTDLDALQVKLVLSSNALILRGHLALLYHVV